MSAITRRINRLLDSHSISEEDLREIVEQYEGELSIANQKLGDAVDLVRRGLRSEAMAIIGSSPSLIDQANELSIPRLDELRELMDLYGLPPIAVVDTKAIKVLTPPVQPRIAVAANRSASVKANEPNDKFPQPPAIPARRDLPPPLKANSSSTRNYVWPLMAAALLLLCLGGAALLYFLQTNSDDLLAELNATAGIKNPPELDVSPSVQPETGVEMEPEPDRGPDTAADADAKEAERTKADATKRQSLEKLAKRILEGEDFLSDVNEKSITKFSDKVKNELQLLTEQSKQFNELSIHPPDDKLTKWVRNEDGMKQLTSFIEDRKNDIENLKQHPPLKDLRDHRERLAAELEAWDVEAKKWEGEQEKYLELTERVPDSRKVEQTITKVRATANTHLLKSMSGLLDRYEKLSTEKNQVAASIEKQLDPLQQELAADRTRRRDSHRLTIYFDGDSNRNEDRLQIKPRCEIVLNPDDLKAIDRLRVHDSKPIPLSQSSYDVKLPGRFEGWLTVMRVDSEIILKLNPRTIPQAIQEQYPLLKQLDQFVKQQDATFESYTGLTTRFETNQELKDRLENISQWNEVMGMMDPLLTQPPAKELDDLYITQTGQTVDNLRSLKSSIDEAFGQFVTPVVAIGEEIEEHIKNLEALRDNYLQLKANTGLLNFEGQLVFGNTSGSSLGQSTFEPVETFELFFFPELVYGPPPTNNN